MNQEIGPTPLGKAVMVLFILGCLVFAAMNFSPSLKNAIMGIGSSSGTPSSSSGGPAGPGPTGSPEPVKVEAPDTKGITTVQEYSYVPQEKLPPVKGVSGYEWDETRKTVEFPINVWIGWLPIVAANNGFAPNDESVFFKKYGFRVNLKLVDDPVAARDAYAAGKSHVLWGTLDMMVLFAGELMKDSRTAPRIYQQIDWSNGGDGIVVRGAIRSVKDLKGKTVVYAQNSPSQYFINNLLINAGVRPNQVTHKYTATAFEAAAAFVSDKTIDACVSWAPDIYTIPEKVAGTRVLTTTAEANRLIADVYAVRADFAKDHPEIVKGLVAGIFEGMALLKNSAHKARAFQWMADGYGMKVEDIKSMENDAYITGFGDNKEFFLNKNNPTNFERTWNNITAVYRELGLVGTPVRFDEVMDFSVIQALDKAGTFKDQDQVARSTFVPTSYKKVSAEAPVLTQTVRINFYPNSANLYEPEHDEFGVAIPNTLYDPSVDATLEKVGRLVGQYERALIGIVGHTDSSMKGKVPEKAVKELSEARAQAVRDALIRKYRFPPNKLIAVGKGWEEPADPNDPANHALNRRVEIQVFTPEQ
ncbi:MAG: Urea carboxylase-related ABC transporter, periplasmic substrate-binding protein [Candidatus Ozemobacter sibiricus]|jgi:NitT/TauT family transport system substrate-binding protein|uniref:Urea carboxylase-related ABC transporter, periplasmic substrate-binding protein n=1 Tax=Candidatus Ozemobacter sibiricus TaxID=2268124 RepID=A0A367ZSS5_9BACT|nr:MAG: Urea carboxylase-related ABC transporter, periplasmic substrate-binding protein [Candidatus Ozemobacter sibiricus]